MYAMLSEANVRNLFTSFWKCLNYYNNVKLCTKVCFIIFQTLQIRVSFVTILIFELCLLLVPISWPAMKPPESRCRGHQKPQDGIQAVGLPPFPYFMWFFSIILLFTPYIGFVDTGHITHSSMSI